MEARMKIYTETERQEHVENWKSGTLSKAAYAKSAGIFPTTFYHWTKEKSKVKYQDFVEINKRLIPKTGTDMIIEKGTITIRVPLSAGQKELQSIITVLEGTQ